MSDTDTTPQIAQALSVSQYSSRLAQAVRHVGPAVLEGEVQKVNTSGRSGMLYFDLTDGTAALSCKVFARDVQRLRHRPSAGDLVRVKVDRPDLYPATGSLSLIVSNIALAGEGELLRRRQALIERLSAEGLCDPTRRRALPRFPHTVAVIAGKDSHGMADVVTALRDRWPAANILTYPCLVQGAAAPAQLIDALATLQERCCAEVIIMARGGGSVQDLACFDDEGLCRALFACEIPVICAIGHTENNPVCNHVTWSAYTPSRSAEMAVPSIAEVRETIRSNTERLAVASTTIARRSEQLGEIAHRMRPEHHLATRLHNTRHIGSLIDRAVASFFNDRTAHLGGARAVLAAAPGQAALALQAQRSTIVRHSDVIARSAEALATVRATLADTGARLAGSVRRQLEAQVETHKGAIARTQADALAAIRRRDAQHTSAIASISATIAGAPAKTLAAASTAVAHTGQLIAARDFRRHGWMLGAIGDRPVRSVADLAGDEPVSLTLHDGAAVVRVDSIQSNPTSQSRKDSPHA